MKTQMKKVCSPFNLHLFQFCKFPHFIFAVLAYVCHLLCLEPLTFIFIHVLILHINAISILLKIHTSLTYVHFANSYRNIRPSKIKCDIRYTNKIIYMQ